MSGSDQRHVENEFLPFSMVPEAVIYDRSLSDKAVRVYACLLRHGDDPADCYPSHDRIADLIGCERRSIQRPLRQLEDAGWVQRVPRRNPDGSRTSDGFLVRRSSALLSAGTAQESAVGTRSAARGHRAESSQEREPGNESHLNETSSSARADTVADEHQDDDVFVKALELIADAALAARDDVAWKAGPVVQRHRWRERDIRERRLQHRVAAAAFLAESPDASAADLAVHLEPELFDELQGFVTLPKYL